MLQTRLRAAASAQDFWTLQPPPRPAEEISFCLLDSAARRNSSIRRPVCPSKDTERSKEHHDGFAGFSPLYRLDDEAAELSLDTNRAWRRCAVSGIDI